MSKPLCYLALLLPIASLPCTVRATGDWGPHSWLEDGGQALLHAPEFYWELECKRIAEDFKPREKLPETTDNKPLDTGKVDGEEYEAAVKSGYVKTPDADAAIKNHRAYRAVIDATAAKASANADKDNSEPPLPNNNPPAPAKPDAPPAPATPLKADGEPDLPAEPDSEFADYNKGALHYGHGQDAAVSRTAWTKILQRPAAERKYRSTWAAYMLGKLCIDTKEYPQAVKYFQQTRQLAQEGFADALGLAADSYGWEAKAELEMGHMDKAARLYLTQLALGDDSAVSSLKYLIPDRDKVLGRNDDNAAKPNAANKSAFDADREMHAAIEAAAADPVLRRLETAHILCVGVDMNYPTTSDQPGKPNPVRQAQWLAAIEKAKVKKTPDAEELGWVAYTMGKYADAAHWLALSSGDSVTALWLKGKLALHDGKLADGAKDLQAAMRAMQDSPLDQLGAGYIAEPGTALRGDAGTVLLSRGDFVQAFEAFYNAKLWEDAAYVAERVFTTKELIEYVDKHFPEPPPSKDNDKNKPAPSDEDDWKTQGPIKMRLLLARRLVREDDYATARKYFTPELQKTLESYTAALTKGMNTHQSNKEQARALFTAAWIARFSGMELMGTEAGPDLTSYVGETSMPNVAMLRLTGKNHADEDSHGEEPKPHPVSFAVPVSAEEKKRLAASKINPEQRFHYRYVAAGLAWKAANLLPDGAEETADVLNSAGNWLKDRNEKAADRFYQAIEKRCPKTEIGRDAVKKHWFSDVEGPWSKAEEAAHPNPDAK